MKECVEVVYLLPLKRNNVSSSGVDSKMCCNIGMSSLVSFLENHALNVS